MGKLIVVRHGQASYGSEDYDRLSETGRQQCELLGRHWAAQGMSVDEVLVGPARRHWQSHDAAAEAYRAAGCTWPEPVEDRLLNEYSAFEVMDHAISPGEHRRLVVNTEEGRRHYFRTFRQTMRRWVRGEIPTPGVESWTAFRRRVEASAERVRQSADGKNIVLFTSGGPASAIVGYALGLDDLRTMELSWSVSNGSFCELLVSHAPNDERFMLLSFNQTPHLDPGMVTGA